MGYNGYPVTIRTNGLIITRTYLNPDKSGRDDECLEMVQIDPNYQNPEVPSENTVSPEPKKSGVYTLTTHIPLSTQNVTWQSARALRAKWDKEHEWCEALYSGIMGE